eukprot:CAMPEP_0168825340 /NCGR_PEP_ID=MMETSP0726-20121227/11585_1 /TAXON_ID=265536 /ORGANISM="Amphiprora sp., Strain CCMP467" /LENGTH=92 /DNA_ID=CAMNT_0008878421 /DNA_START=62 /DNA_END=340 /DNA_ORIENTATION=-
MYELELETFNAAPVEAMAYGLRSPTMRTAALTLSMLSMSTGSNSKISSGSSDGSLISSVESANVFRSALPGISTSPSPSPSSSSSTSSTAGI